MGAELDDAAVNHRWLVLRLEAPLMAFGGIAVDQVGPVRDFPSISMITGLFANALGWRRSDHAAHQDLQDRLIVGARREREADRLMDTQNVHLAKIDKGWTSHGVPDGRQGASYKTPHRRQRWYHADLAVCVVVRLVPEEAAPSLGSLAEALDRPSRPLFLGRKTCLPSSPVLSPESDRWVLADTAHAALCAVVGTCGASLRAIWPMGEGPNMIGDGVERIVDMPDLRNWRTGLHSGSRQVVEGRVMPIQAGT